MAHRTHVLVVLTFYIRTQETQLSAKDKEKKLFKMTAEYIYNWRSQAAW